MKRLLAFAALLACLGGPAAAGDGAPPVEAGPPVARDLAIQGPSLASRLAEIQRRVQAVARYPESARARGIGGEARVGFEIERDGRAVNVALLESSGSTSLDRAAERAVREAGALPWVVGRVAVPVRFELTASERAD